MEKATLETVIVRKATAPDIAAIEVFIKSFVASGKLLPRTLEELESLVNTLFVAERDGEIVGTAALEIYNHKLAEIRSLAVAESLRGSGVGKQLVEACVTLAKENNIYEIMAISSSEAFFKACGFDFTLPNERKAFFMQTRDEL